MEGDYITMTVIAANDLRVAGALHKMIDINGNFSVAGGALTAGALTSQANSGHACAVAIVGEKKVWFGAAVQTAAYPLTTAASGFVVAATSGAHVIGKSLKTQSSGDLARALINLTLPRALGAGSGYV